MEILFKDNSAICFILKKDSSKLSVENQLIIFILHKINIFQACMPKYKYLMVNFILKISVVQMVLGEGSALKELKVRAYFYKVDPYSK